MSELTPLELLGLFMAKIKHAQSMGVFFPDKTGSGTNYRVNIPTTDSAGGLMIMAAQYEVDYTENRLVILREEEAVSLAEYMQMYLQVGHYKISVTRKDRWLKESDLDHFIKTHDASRLAEQPQGQNDQSA